MKQRKASSRSASASRRLFIAIAILGAVLAYAAWRELSPDSAWNQLSTRYPARPESSLYRQQRTVELVTGSGFVVSRYTATVDWRESSLFLGQTGQFLGQRFDLAPIHPPMQIPVSAIRTCTVKQIHADTGVELVIAEPDVRIGFTGYGASYDHAIVDWCENVGITVTIEQSTPSQEP